MRNGFSFVILFPHLARISVAASKFQIRQESSAFKGRKYRTSRRTLEASRTEWLRGWGGSRYPLVMSVTKVVPATQTPRSTLHPSHEVLSLSSTILGLSTKLPDGLFCIQFSSIHLASTYRLRACNLEDSCPYTRGIPMCHSGVVLKSATILAHLRRRPRRHTRFEAVYGPDAWY